jgi:hypothetical protein
MERRFVAILMCLSLVLVFALPTLAQDGTAEPTAEVTDPPAEPTVEPTSEVTVEPTSEVTVEPTGEVTAEPTGEATAEPTAEATAAPPQLPPPPENAILTGLNFPRGVAYDAAGNLYAGESGLGGT